MEESEESSDQEYPLADLVSALYREIAESHHRARGQGSFMAWTGAEVEVAVTWESRLEGGLDLKVLKLGGDRTRSNSNTLRLTLAPKDPEEISAQDMRKG
jgi:hypothetical protein